VYIFVVIILSLFLTLFKIEGSSLTVTYGDTLSIVLLVIFLKNFIENKLSNNFFSKYWFIYLSILFITGIFNLTLFEGEYLNIFRTNLISLIYFIFIYTYVKNGKINSKQFAIGIALLAIAFLLKTWPEMQQAWTTSDLGFTDVNIFDSSLNLNTWGFSLLLLLVIFSYESLDRFNIIFLTCCLVCVYFIFFSYSRTSYILTFLLFLYIVLYVKRVKTSIAVLIACTIPFIFFLYQSFSSKIVISDSTYEFLSRKQETFGNDLVDDRFYTINIKPITENFSDFNVFQMFFGDGHSIQHSFFSHTLVVTGILGFIIFILRFLLTISYSFKNIKLKNKPVESKYLFLLLVIFIVNDFITNLSSYLPFAAYLSAIIFAYFFGMVDRDINFETESKGSTE
jgi:hypothetical protein